MTMLDRMRRHKGWLKWSLVLVVLAFIFFYVPDFLRPRTGGAAASEEVAVVGSESITARQFRRAYQQQMQAYRSAYGANFNEHMLKQIGIEQQILRQLVDESAAVVEAGVWGSRVSDAEVAQRIFAIPAFQQNGVFAGEAALPARARGAEPAAVEGRVRGQPAAVAARGQAARRR